MFEDDGAVDDGANPESEPLHAVNTTTTRRGSRKALTVVCNVLKLNTPSFRINVKKSLTKC